FPKHAPAIGVLSGVPQEQAALVGEWGRAVGLAFQVQDDYLGIWGDPAETGKSNTNDISRRKKTFPVVHALEQPRVRDVIRAVYTQPEIGDDAVKTVVDALESADAPQACREKATELSRAADRLLEQLELTPDESMRFQSIANYIINRRS
ncbi:MAG: polyprenyl synthetase family protein, partial [Anaerolineaceae bacterium]